MSEKDLKTFADLRKIEVNAKESILRLIKFIDLCAKQNISMSSENSVDISKKQLIDVSSSLRQHIRDDLEDHYPIKIHFINYCLGNDHMTLYKHDHR